MSGPVRTGRTSRFVNHIRVLAAVLLISVAVLATCATVLAHWSDAVLLDTPTFMGAIEPVVRDEAVRDRAADTIATTVIDALDVRTLAASAIPGTDPPLADEIATGFEAFARETISTAVATDAFERLWLTEMRLWHLKLAGAVRADASEYAAEAFTIRVSLGPYIDLLADQVERSLVRRLIISLVPDTVRQMQVVVLDAELVADRLEPLRSLDRARPYLPWIAVSAFLLALLVGSRASYTLLGGGVALTLGSLLAVALSRAEASRVEALIQSTFSASPESAAGLAEVLFQPLEMWMGYLTLSGILIATLGVGVIGARRWQRSRR